MSNENKNHGHWRVYGWSDTCSNCGHSRIGATNYCMNCGSLMDEALEYVVPKLEKVQIPRRIICPFCNQDMYEIKELVKFCYNCGQRLEFSDE